MKGSEKQIAWATEIRNNIISAFESSKSGIPAGHPVLTKIDGMAQRLNDAEYAGAIIDLFKDIQFNGDLQHDIPCIMAVYKVCPGMTDGQKAILGK